MRAVRHPESWVEIDQAHRVPLPYLPTYSGFGERIDDVHRALAAAPVKGPLIDLGIPGWLRVEDSLKLYELAYFCAGDILELGTHQGLRWRHRARMIPSQRSILTLPHRLPPNAISSRSGTWAAS
jgi:hypothetical protein